MSKYIVSLLSILALSACSGGGLVWDGTPANTAPAPSGGVVKIGKPYKIAGKWYTPSVQPNYDEVGYASWYGPQFHGKSTANGEVFNMNQVTAAHKTLPLPSYVRVTNLSNNRTIIVRVNDRGPFVGDRIIDLSRRSAQLLGFEKKGVEKVRVELVEYKGGKYIVPTSSRRENKEDRTIDIPMPVGNVLSTPVPAQTAVDVPVSTVGDRHFVQIGAFSSQSSAEALVGTLSALGPVMVQPVSVGKNILFRVRLGPFDNAGQADKALSGALSAGFDKARIFTEDSQ